MNDVTRPRWKLCSLLSLIVLAGCGSSSIESVQSPDSLTLYSIDGRDFFPGKGPKKPETDETFHGYPVLGKVQIKDPAKRASIMAALKKGIDNADGMAKCFWPRHGIRATKNGKTIEYVVCFECQQLTIHTNNGSNRKAITRDPQSVFNKHLTNAKVTLAPTKE